MLATEPLVPSPDHASGQQGLAVLVTGASGYVGSRLTPQLLGDGHRVRGFVRDADKLESRDIEVAEGDAETGEGLREAMEGVDVVFFLIHAMDGGAEFGETERQTAEHTVEAAQAHSVRRVVYLGGVLPEEDRSGGSEHLESRREVEDLLLDGFPEAVALRASMLIGAGSASFDLLAGLVERLPLLALPAWQDNRTAPIDERDAIEYLVRSATLDLAGDARRTFDIGGPEEMTYGTMVERIAALAGRERPSVRLPVSATPVASRVAAATTGQEHALVEPLMRSLEYDLIPDTTAADAAFGLRPRGFDESVRWALAERGRGE